MFNSLKDFIFGYRLQKRAVDLQAEGLGRSDVAPGPAREPVTICITNQKGGCAKTTTAINLSAGLARQGFKVLLIDLDPQGHSTIGLGLDIDGLRQTMYDVLAKNIDLASVRAPTRIHNLDIAPANKLLSGVPLEIANLIGRATILKVALNKMFNVQKHHYDYVVMDCSPSLDLVTLNAMSASRNFIVPVQSHFFSLEGMRELFSTVTLVQEHFNEQLSLLGILLTMYDGRANINREIHDQLYDFFKEKMFRTPVRMNIKLVEAQAKGASIFEYAPSSAGAEDYGRVVDEVIQRTKLSARSFADDTVELSSR